MIMTDKIRRRGSGNGRSDLMNSNRIRGALYGVAVGDALGAPLEFMTAEQIQKKYGSSDNNKNCGKKTYSHSV